jgi:hypothetical protein
MPRIARDGKRYVKRCHSLPEGWKTLEKREAMLEKRKNVESHAWGDLKCDRAVIEMETEHRVDRIEE